MIRAWQRFALAAAVGTGFAAFFLVGWHLCFNEPALARSNAGPSATPVISQTFDQTAAMAKLREQIKGREREPAETVFKNIQTAMFKGQPAARLLAVMEMGYARSLGVSCTHCHMPDKWEAEDKPQKQIGRDMIAMTARINNEMLKSIKNLKGTAPTINCTTCHRGDLKPALNPPAPR